MRPDQVQLAQDLDRDIGVDGHGSRSKRAVAAAEEEQREAGGQREQVQHAAHHPVVVPGIGDRVHLAVDEGHGVGQDRAAVLGQLPFEALQFIGLARGHRPAQVLLVAGQHVDAEFCARAVLQCSP